MTNNKTVIQVVAGEFIPDPEEPGEMMQMNTQVSCLDCVTVMIHAPVEYRIHVLLRAVYAAMTGLGYAPETLAKFMKSPEELWKMQDADDADSAVDAVAAMAADMKAAVEKDNPPPDLFEIILKKGQELAGGADKLTAKEFSNWVRIATPDPDKPNVRTLQFKHAANRPAWAIKMAELSTSGMLVMEGSGHQVVPLPAGIDCNAPMSTLRLPKGSNAEMTAAELMKNAFHTLRLKFPISRELFDTHVKCEVGQNGKGEKKMLIFTFPKTDNPPPWLGLAIDAFIQTNKEMEKLYGFEP